MPTREADFLPFSAYIKARPWPPRAPVLWRALWQDFLSYVQKFKGPFFILKKWNMIQYARKNNFLVGDPTKYYFGKGYIHLRRRQIFILF